jgi:hypothetical protein
MLAIVGPGNVQLAGNRRRGKTSLGLSKSHQADSGNAPTLVISAFGRSSESGLPCTM